MYSLLYSYFRAVKVTSGLEQLGAVVVASTSCNHQSQQQPDPRPGGYLAKGAS